MADLLDQAHAVVLTALWYLLLPYVWAPTVGLAAAAGWWARGRRERGRCAARLDEHVDTALAALRADARQPTPVDQIRDYRQRREADRT